MERLDRLLDVLRRRGLSRGEEIRKELGISQPAMFRLMREAGPRVCRFGRSVATRYALARDIAGLGRHTPVFQVDEQGRAEQRGVLYFLSGGGCWLEREQEGGQSFPGLPPFAEDMRPQGYMGRGFSTIYPELKLPSRIRDWNDDHQLIALAMRGEDCVGNLIIGEESLNRFLAGTPKIHTRSDYQTLAEASLLGQPGSSAGGEHPKFAVDSGSRHLLVKFASGDGVAAERWRDLLVCEHLALETLRDAGIAVPNSDWFDHNGTRYFEVERFDRVGKRGRLGVISLYAINCYYLGDDFDSWSKAGQRILKEPSLKMHLSEAERMIWLDTFGSLIGNTDRHFGNFSFFTDEANQLVLTPAPVYDMLPMVFAPSDANLVERQFAPRPPTAMNLHVWHDAANHALKYWSRLSEEDRLTPAFRHLTVDCRDTLSRLIREQR